MYFVLTLRSLQPAKMQKAIFSALDITERWYEALPVLHLEIFNRYENSSDMAISGDDTCMGSGWYQHNSVDVFCLFLQTVSLEKMSLTREIQEFV